MRLRETVLRRAVVSALLVFVGLVLPLALAVRPSDTDNQLSPTPRPTDQLSAETELKTAVKDREEAHRFFQESELSFQQHQAPEDTQRAESEKHLNQAYQKLVASQEKYLVARYDAAEAIFDARSEGRDTPTTHRLAHLLATEEKKDNQQEGDAPKPSAPKNDTSAITEIDPDEIPTGEKPIDLEQHKKAERQAKADLIEARKAAKILKERAHRTFQEALKAPTQADRDRILAAAQARLDEASEALEQARAARARLRRARAAIRKAAQARANLVVQQSDSLDRAVSAVSSRSRDLEAQMSSLKDQLKQLKVTMGQTQNSIDNPVSDSEKAQSEKTLAQQKKQQEELEDKLKSVRVQEADVKKEVTKRVRKARGVRKQAHSAQSLLTFVRTLRAAKHEVRSARKEVKRASTEAERLWRKADELGLAARTAAANETVQAETAADMARRVASEADANVEHALKDLQRAQRNLQHVQDEHFQQLIDLAQEKVKHAAANLSRARSFRQRLKLSAQQFTDEARELDAQVESAAATAVVKRQEQVDAAKNQDGASEAQESAIKAERNAQSLRDQADAANERATQARLRAEKAASFVDTAVRRSRAAQRALARVKVDAAISHARALRKEADSLFALANKQYEISEHLSEESLNAKGANRKLLEMSAKRELNRAKKTTAQAVRASRAANFAEKILRRRLRKFLFEASLRSNKEIESAKRAVHRTETLAHYTGHRARILRSQSDKLVSIAKQLKDKADRASAKVIAEPDPAKAAALAKLAEVAKQRYQDFQQLRLDSKNKAAVLAEADAREAEKRAEQVAAEQTKTQIEGEQEVENALVRMTEHAIQVAATASEHAKIAGDNVAAKVRYVQDLHSKANKNVQTRRERKLKMALVKHQRGVSLRLARHARRLAKRARAAAKHLRRALKFKAKILREALDHQVERSKRLQERATKAEAKAKLNEKAAADSDAKLTELKAVVKDKQDALAQETEAAAKDTAQSALQAAQHQLELLEAEHKVLQDRAKRSRLIADNWKERHRRSVAKHLETLRQIKEIRKQSAKIVARLFSEANHAQTSADKTIRQLESLFGGPMHLIKTGNSKVDIELAKQPIGDPQSPLTVAITNKSFKKTRQELLHLRSEAAQLLKTAEAAAHNVTANLAAETDKEAKKQAASQVVQLAKKAVNSSEHHLQELNALTRSFAEQVDRAALAVTQRLMRETKTATKRVDRRVSSLSDQARDAVNKAQAAEAALQKAEAVQNPDVKQVRKLRQAAAKAAQASRTAQKKLLLAAHASAQSVYGPARAKLHKVVSIARQSIESIAKETRGKARRYVVVVQKALRKARTALGDLKSNKSTHKKSSRKEKRRKAGEEEKEVEAPEDS